MSGWRLAESLKKLREQIDAAYPNRSKASDGSIGDLNHRQRKSDHNPNFAGTVCAIDITHDPASGVDCNKLAAQLFNSKDPRIKYVIWNARITNKDKSGWKPYTGINAHKHHLHISVGGDYDNRDAWILGDITPSGSVSTPAPIVSVRDLKIGDSGDDVKALQKAIGVDADGYFGLNTKKAVLNIQVKHGLRADGIVGPATKKAIGI